MSGGVVGREGKLAALPWFQREMGGLALQTIEALVPYIQVCIDTLANSIDLLSKCSIANSIRSFVKFDCDALATLHIFLQFCSLNDRHALWMCVFGDSSPVLFSCNAFRTLEIPQTKSCRNGRKRSVQPPAPLVISASISSTSLEQSVQRRRCSRSTQSLTFYSTSKTFLSEFYSSSQVCCHYLGAKSSKSSVQTILDVHIVDNICIVLNFWKQASVQRRFSTRKTGGSTCRAVAALAPKWLPAQGGYRDVTLLEEQ
uniref:Uncharacterized protein n=1 Tax=Aegilops tauschii subsp. strangulata TaxID=200361 RepID=A0A453RIS5_AEGTS